MKRLPAAAAAAGAMLLTLTGCGVQETGVVGAGMPAEGILAPSDAEHPASVYVYLIFDDRLIQVRRDSPAGDSPQAAVNLLFNGLDRDNVEGGLTSQLPNGPLPSVTVTAAGVDVAFSAGIPQLSPLALDQLVCTASTAFARRRTAPGPSTAPGAPAPPGLTAVTVSASGWSTQQKCPLAIR